MNMTGTCDEVSCFKSTIGTHFYLFKIAHYSSSVCFPVKRGPSMETGGDPRADGTRWERLGTSFGTE